MSIFNYEMEDISYCGAVLKPALFCLSVGKRWWDIYPPGPLDSKADLGTDAAGVNRQDTSW